MTTRQRAPLRNLGLASLAALCLAGIWLWGIHPARGLERGEVAKIVMATNRIHQPLWDLGYRLDDCGEITDSGDPKGFDPKYTCSLSGRAAEEVRMAVKSPSRSYYVMGKPPAEDPVHAVSLRMDAGGVSYLLAVESLEAADAGLFYGFRVQGESILSEDIRWFRYSNPELGRVLKELRRNGSPHP